MRGEIIAIGDELTTGQRLDTNTKWLAQQLTDIGVDIKYHTTVCDELPANVEAFSLACERADVVVATGGLGPTADDLTREALAAAAGAPLVEDAGSLASIQQLFASRGRPMPEKNKLQALFPEGAQPISNEHGTAPGIQLSVPRDGRRACTLFCLPGVPAEMKPMWTATVAPAILALHDHPRVTRHRRLKCFGVGESHLEAMMPDLISREREPRVGITVSKATITLRITASGPNPEHCYERMKPTEQEIRQTLGELVFGEEDEELQNVAVRLLSDRSQTLAACDALTHGQMVRWLSKADSSGIAFTHGEVSCDLVTAGKVDGEVAAGKYAEQFRQTHGTDFAMLLAPETKTHAIDSVLVALAYDGGVRTKVFANLGHPDIAQDRAAKLALNYIRLHLLNKE